MFVSEIQDFSKLRVLKNGAAVIAPYHEEGEDVQCSCCAGSLDLSRDGFVCSNCEPEKWEAMRETETFDRRVADYNYGEVWVNGIPRKIK